MKFKFKINENTTLQDIRDELDHLKSANVTELPLNHLKKIIYFLGATEATTTGSSVRFHHKLLIGHPNHNGFFQVHKVHKGGDQDLIRMFDYRNFLYKALVTIIEIKETNEKK